MKYTMKYIMKFYLAIRKTLMMPFEGYNDGYSPSGYSWIYPTGYSHIKQNKFNS